MESMVRNGREESKTSVLLKYRSTKKYEEVSRSAEEILRSTEVCFLPL
jgi:hypothetical protein